MDKDTILAKSREDHKNQDLYKAEVEIRAGTTGMIAATALATVFFVVQFFAGKGANLGLYAILFSVGAAQFIVKALRFRQTRMVVLAVVYTAMTLAASALHIAGLLGA